MHGKVSHGGLYFMQNRDLLHKPNQTIMISSKDISLNQRKAYNVILYKAWNELKTNENQTIFEFNISELKEKAGIKATDNWHLKRCLENLSDVKVENIKDNGDWSFFRLLSSATKNGNVLEIELPSPIRKALIKNNFYTTLDLLTIKSLEGKYSVIFYEMAIRYQKKEVPEMKIEELRLLTGTMERKSYNDFGVFRQKVLTPAIKEINEKTDIILDYDIKKEGNKVITVKFKVKYKGTQQQLEEHTDINILDIMQAFERGTGGRLNSKVIAELVEVLGLEKVKRQLDTFLDLDHSGMKSVEAVFIGMLKKNKEFTKTKGKTRQQGNFEQRKYDDDFFDTLYENI